MAASSILEQLKTKQVEEGLSLRRIAAESGITQPQLTMLFSGKRRLTSEAERKIRTYLSPKPSLSLGLTLERFISDGVHKSHKTIETLRERLIPFVDYLARCGVGCPTDITRDHVEEFLREIGRGRRGKPLSPSSLFGFTKDVQAFVNYIAENVAPEDWRNPVRKLHCKHPQVTIHPLSLAQVDRLFKVVEDLAPSPLLKARNKAMLYVLLDGGLRISELMNTVEADLNVDGTLRVLGKGAKEMEVALAARTLESVNQYLSLRQDTGPFLFVSENGKRLTYEGVKSLFHRWRKASPESFRGVRLSAHTLRHTSATMRRVAGMSEGDLQTFLGHADLTPGNSSSGK